ncbi:hypothetical protein L1887_43904 [Cichorium endivia]|nr:hypothetical protein L1887_43904 [Cichorium endivia]
MANSIGRLSKITPPAFIISGRWNLSPKASSRPAAGSSEIGSIKARPIIDNLDSDLTNPDIRLMLISPEASDGSGRNGYALSFKAHGLTRDNLAALAGFHRTVDFHSPVGDNDFGLRTAFAPAFQLEQIAQLNVRVFT